MTAEELGTIIKEARLEKKLTQSEVVGSYITRNMLSQIENGVATPSVRTLQYLAERLDLSMAQFAEEREPEERENRLAAWRRVKETYQKMEYEECLQQLTPFAQKGEVLYDEACSLTALCEMKLAENKYAEKEQREAAKHAKKAMDAATIGIYANRSLVAEAVMLLREAESHV